MEQASLRVYNQFKFPMAEARTACLPISIMATYHQYALRDAGVQEEWQWNCIMEQGAKLWRAWHRQLPSSALERQFPTVHEILALPECETFVREFGRSPIEYAGMVRDIGGCDNPEGSLEYMLCDMVTRLKKKNSGAICCLLVLPNAISVSMLCLPCEGSARGYEIRYFDSHGCREHDYVDYGVFDDYRALLAYVLSRYRLPRLEANELRRLDRLYNTMEIQTMFGYSAMLFCK